MSTPIQPVPDVVLASEFPTLADRPAGTYNQKAAAWANSENAMVTRTREIVVVGRNNALAAEERALEAETHKNAAASSASTANSQANAAAASAASAAADAAKTAADRQTIENAIVDGPVLSVAGKSGVVTLDKADVGLGDVDNTSDADKPVSTATQSALDAKANTTLSNVTQATVRARAGTGTMAYRNLTISTGAPSGGVDGDVWFQVES